MKTLPWILLGVVSAACVLAVVVGRPSEEKLTPRAERILRDLYAGRADRVYAAGARDLCESLTEDDLEKYVASRRSALGDYRRVAFTRGIDTPLGADPGTRREVHLVLVCDRGQASCDIELANEDGDGRLSWIRIEPLPEGGAR